MSRFKEVIVVEGYHDLSKLRQIYDNVDIIITNGSEISQATLEELKILNKTRGLILFLDPDFQGERIRRIINDFVGETKHAFLEKSKCISKNKKKVGIEHADNEDIRGALNNLLLPKHNEKEITYNDLFQLGLIGSINSKIKREKLSNNTGIGLCNGKTLCYKLNMFGYSLDEVKEMIGQ